MSQKNNKMIVDEKSKVVIEYKSSDRVNWLQNHTLSVDDRKKMIDEKTERLYNQSELNKKARAIFAEC